MSRRIALTLAISEYDHVRDLIEGRVVAEGIELSGLTFPVEEIFYRFLRFREWDMSEMSMGRYVSMLSYGERGFVGIPVFPSRMFRHSSIYIRRDRKISTPSDLRGKRIGIPEWAQTAGIYVRGIMQEHFSVRPSEVEWVQAGVYKCGRTEEVTVTPPAGVVIERIANDTLSDMLEQGRLDAVISAHPPLAIVAGKSGFGRLFENSIEVEHAYWKTTGVFPIMHVILLRRDVFDRHPWVAMNMLTAFEEAKSRSMKRATEMTASRYGMPWLSDHVGKIRELMGEDYWPYGVEKNQRTLETFLRYAFEQGVSQRKLSIDDLFPPEVRTSYAI